MSATLRLATAADAPGILAIYSPYIKSFGYTFETEVPPVENFAERIETYLQTWPWIVYEENGIVAGYAYAGRYRERAAYQWCTESSIYIADVYKGTGLAEALYQALFAILRKQGFKTVYAVITLPNPPSTTFHERMGFTYFTTYENVGYKAGWKNVGWWRLALGEFEPEPTPPVPFASLNKDFLPQLFDAYAGRIRKK